MVKRSRIKVDSLPACPEGLPTIVAVPTGEGDLLIGEEANQAHEAAYFKLANWKMLLGKSSAELEAEKATNSDLAKLLKETTLDEIALGYFKAMLERTLGSEPEIQEKPQTIIGVPPCVSQDQVRWRQNYKRRIERVFEQLGYPKPRFWPEPFAVFQYHLNLVEIHDVGTRQNVLILDVGGATTNVCLIQTTQHGRLARGGVNHVPHGVKSTEVGGATFDASIANRLGLEGSVSQIVRHVKSAKERLSALQPNWDDLDLTSRVEFDWQGGSVELSAVLVKQAFVENVWPAISATLDESLEEVETKGIIADRVHVVILAGGVCQMGLLQDLVERKLTKSRRFTGARFLVSSDYRSAVAHGLAIEAAANSRHHEMLPSRVSAYLQEDLKFECGHNGNELYKPVKLKSDYRSQGDLPKGILLKAPKEIGLMVNKPRTWSFRLRQNSRELFYRFSKLSGSGSADYILDGWRRISRTKDRRAGRQLVLTMTLQEDGFAKLSVDTVDDLSYELKPIDLHDLSELVGDTFFAVDFGTDNTQVAYVNVKDPDLLQALPSTYAVDPRAERRVRDLMAQVDRVLGPSLERRSKIARINEEGITEYVYHSNRIEGSKLDRGGTQQALDAAGELDPRATESAFDDASRFGVIDERGQIVEAPMLIRDAQAAVNLREAFRFVEQLAEDPDQHLTAVSLRQIHQLVMKGEQAASPGRFRKENVAISQTTFVPPDFVQIEPLSQAMLDRFRSDEFGELAPIVQAVEAHARFVSIHPFSDGNGRVARLLANYFMWRRNLPGFLLPWENRERYYDALEECNSKEPGLWGNLTDLTNLFCDVLEGTVEQMEEAEADRLGAVDEATVVDSNPLDSEFARLITDLKGSGKARPLNFREQYEDWFNTMSAVVSEVKELSGQLSRVFRTEWQGEVMVTDYPIIELDTYRAIRTRQRFARTWCLKIDFDLLVDQEELVFYFGPSSKLAEELNPLLRHTCSLHVSRFSSDVSYHVQVARQQWSRVLEVTHDGSDLGVILKGERGKTPLYAQDERARVENWFGMLVKDLLESRKS